MTFAYPKLIVLLVIPVALLFWEWVRQGRPLVMPFDDVHQRRGWLVGLPVLMANSLPAVLLALAIIFLARPLTYAPPKTQRELTNIQIVLDSSTSMVFNTYGPQEGDKPYVRFHGAMDALEKFLTARARRCVRPDHLFASVPPLGSADSGHGSHPHGAEDHLAGNVSRRDLGPHVHRQGTGRGHCPAVQAPRRRSDDHLWPTPGRASRRADSPRTKRSKIRARSSGGTPGPRSRTSMR